MGEIKGCEGVNNKMEEGEGKVECMKETCGETGHRPNSNGSTSRKKAGWEERENTETQGRRGT